MSPWRCSVDAASVWQPGFNPNSGEPAAEATAALNGSSRAGSAGGRAAARWEFGEGGTAACWAIACGRRQRCAAVNGGVRGRQGERDRRCGVRGRAGHGAAAWACRGGPAGVSARGGEDGRCGEAAHGRSWHGVAERDAVRDRERGRARGWACARPGAGRGSVHRRGERVAQGQLSTARCTAGEAWVRGGRPERERARARGEWVERERAAELGRGGAACGAAAGSEGGRARGVGERREGGRGKEREKKKKEKENGKEKRKKEKGGDRKREREREGRARRRRSRPWSATRGVGRV